MVVAGKWKHQRLPAIGLERSAVSVLKPQIPPVACVEQTPNPQENAVSNLKFQILSLSFLGPHLRKEKHILYGRLVGKQHT